MLKSILASENLSIATEDSEIVLKSVTDNHWLADGVELEIRETVIPGGKCLTPILRLKKKIAIKTLEIINVPIAGHNQLRFLRFGFNMPGDPVFFGTIGPDGIHPSLSFRLSGKPGNYDESAGCSLRSNSLMGFSDLARKEFHLLGAGSFRLCEGNIQLSCDKPAGKFNLRYFCNLDGAEFAPGEHQLDELVIISGTNLNVMLAGWADYTVAQTSPRIPEVIPTGWNDWQYYRNDKTEQNVTDSAEVIAELKRQGYPLDFIQIDGGFCLHLSEWSEPGPGFPSGIANLSEKIRNMGLKFGLWLAPYIQNVNTKVVREHPEWLLLDNTGKPLELPNSNVGASFLIDYSAPGAAVWLREQVRLFVREWQVTWIKLDGPSYQLYRQGRIRDRSKTIHQMLAMTFDIIREEAGEDVLVEGEGMMGLALGRVDLHRVQTDNHSRWHRDNNTSLPHAPMVYGKEAVMGFLHGRWWCNHRENVILRDFPSPHCHQKAVDSDMTEQLFTAAEMRTQLAVAALSSGGLLLTDPMRELERLPEAMSWIHKLLPVWPQAAEMVDFFPDGRYPAAWKINVELPTEAYTLLAVVNWGEKVADFSFPLEKILPEKTKGKMYYAFSWFDKQLLGVVENQIEIKGVTAHGAKVVCLREQTSHPQLLSTNLHFTQGAADQVSASWDDSSKALDISVKHFYQKNAQLYIALPDAKWRVVDIDSAVSRLHLDDFNPVVNILKFNGIPGKESRFRITWSYYE